MQEIREKNKKIYAIGIGGSGAKCIESVVFLHSIGAFGKNCKLNILLIDADANNGNLTRTSTNIKQVTNCQAIFKQGFSPFMSASFEYYGIWNPLHGKTDQSFKNILEIRVDDPLEDLFNVLYSPDEQKINFNVGFRGKPPIGSAILGTLEIDQGNNRSVRGRRPKTGEINALQRLINDLENDIGNNLEGVAIHLFGSLFGGTGASGVPSLAKLLAERLGNGDLCPIPINASVLLPYFDFDPPEDEDVHAETRFFGLNTQAALYHLYDHADRILDNIYLLGNNAAKRYSPSTGGDTQKNESHFVELYAALSVNDAASKQANGQIRGQAYVHYICGQRPNQLSWDDLPEFDGLNVRQNLKKAARFAHSWLNNFSLELAKATQSDPKFFALGAPWFPVFFSLKSHIKNQDASSSHDHVSIADPRQTNLIALMDNWSESFLNWLNQLATSHHQKALFSFVGVSLNTKNRIYGEKLGSLVISQPLSSVGDKQDCVDYFKNRLADLDHPQEYGVLGLVHHLFLLM